MHCIYRERRHSGKSWSVNLVRLENRSIIRILNFASLHIVLIMPHEEFDNETSQSFNIVIGDCNSHLKQQNAFFLAPRYIPGDELLWQNCPPRNLRCSLNLSIQGLRKLGKCLLESDPLSMTSSCPEVSGKSHHGMDPGDYVQ